MFLYVPNQAHAQSWCVVPCQCQPSYVWTAATLSSLSMPAWLHGLTTFPISLLGDCLICSMNYPSRGAQEHWQWHKGEQGGGNRRRRRRTHRADNTGEGRCDLGLTAMARYYKGLVQSGDTWFDLETAQYSLCWVWSRTKPARSELILGIHFCQQHQLMLHHSFASHGYSFFLWH